ncbi:MAG: aminotransferase class V-fold PLP-dependent enzyme [Bacteroidota bacterium]
MPTTGFDVDKVRSDFPVLHQSAYGKTLVYFDNAATSQKPHAVIDALSDYYSTYNANIHRGVHFLSQKASGAFDEVRLKVRDFINAASENEIVFVRGTTEAINLVASSWGRKNLNQGDVVLVTAMEHHSNIVPWQMVCTEKGAAVVPIPMDDNGVLDMNAFSSLLRQHPVKFVSVVHTSNSLGTINPVHEIIRQSHEKGIPVLVDGAQAVVHEQVDVQALGCDFFAFSGHKMLGPTGVGVLYGKACLLEAMPPYQGGGEMISSVSFSGTTFNEIPFKFEAGTPNIADVIAFGVAIDYLQHMDRPATLDWEQKLLSYATERLSSDCPVRIIGNSPHKASVISFVAEGINALDLGMYLDTMGIAVRTGHHCTEPVMDRFGIPGTVRASFMFYNTLSEIDRFIEAVGKGIRLLKSR